MSYCVNCGVELEEGEKRCPLCATEVVNPNEIKKTDKDNSYPPDRLPPPPADSRKLIAPIAMLMLIPVFATMMCDIIITGQISWSAYVIISVALIYVFVIPPVLFRKQRLTLFITADFAATALFLFLLEKFTGGGTWFMGFAFPMTVCGFGLGGIATLIIRRAAPPKLIKAAVVFASLGIISVINELFISKYLFGTPRFTWSLYVLLICAVLAIVCLLFERNRKIKEKLKQKLFI